MLENCTHIVEINYSKVPASQPFLGMKSNNLSFSYKYFRVVVFREPDLSPLHYVLISIRQSSEFFQTGNFSHILTIMSEIIITCLSWDSFSLFKL